MNAANERKQGAPCRLGIVGYGGFGRFLHRTWSAMGGVAVEAIADAIVQNDPGGVRFYPHWQPLLADERLDLVAVATPPATHAEIACAAMQAGKHVLIEKPLATSLEDARRILQVQRETQRTAGVDYMLRFNPIMEAVHAWCRSGSLGALQRVVVENYAQDDALPEDHWFWDPAQSGGILVEHAVHFIDLVSACTDARPKRVDGLGVRRNARQEDRMMATVVYEDGLVASHFHAFSRPGFFEHTSMRFVFDLAQLDVEGWIPLAGRVTALVNAATEPALARLPGFRVTRRQALEGGQPLRSGGRSYAVETQIEGTFALAQPKLDVYAACLRALLGDLIASLDAPGHRMRVRLEDGLDSLAIALQATEAAHAHATRATEPYRSL